MSDSCSFTLNSWCRRSACCSHSYLRIVCRGKARHRRLPEEKSSPERLRDGRLLLAVPASICAFYWLTAAVAQRRLLLIQQSRAGVCCDDDCDDCCGCCDGPRYRWRECILHQDLASCMSPQPEGHRAEFVPQCRMCLQRIVTRTRTDRHGDPQTCPFNRSPSLHFSASSGMELIVRGGGTLGQLS